ncbi:MAG: hypothetical protein Q4D02_06265 [Clostridia bacterium]|nr:hypothetical protein [Clostridia bacterium]
MNGRVFTSSYDKCSAGNLISISGDRGKSVGFTGKSLPKLAPKLKFWKVWHENIGKIPEDENTRYYIEQYYQQVLTKVDIEELLKDEKDPILLCYEESGVFCHRHIVAEYIQIKYGIEVPEIEISSSLEIKQKERPKNIREILEETIEKEMEGIDR